MISSRLNSHLSHFQVRTSEKGLISFSNEVKEKVGLAKVARREERERKQKEKRELEELVRLAKDILVEDHRKQTEQAKLEKLAEKELKMVKFSNLVLPLSNPSIQVHIRDQPIELSVFISRCPQVSRNLWPKNAHADTLISTRNRNLLDLKPNLG